MAAFRYLLFILSAVFSVRCEHSAVNGTADDGVASSHRQSREVGSYIGLISCAMKYDVPCFVDAAEDYLEIRRTQLLAEADAEALQSTGRSDPESKPSHLANSLGRLIAELTNMFQNGFSSFFKSGREALDDDEEDDETDENELDTTTDSDSVGEARVLTSTKKKKKKKKPLKSLIRLIKVVLVGLIIVFKLAIILKVLQTAMQFKFLLISLGSFAIQAVKFWMAIRNKKDHHEEIVYKNPYTSGDEYSAPGGYGGEYNAARSAQELAYSSQRHA